MWRNGFDAAQKSNLWQAPFLAFNDTLGPLKQSEIINVRPGSKFIVDG